MHGFHSRLGEPPRVALQAAASVSVGPSLDLVPVMLCDLVGLWRRHPILDVLRCTHSDAPFGPAARASPFRPIPQVDRELLFLVTRPIPARLRRRTAEARKAGQTRPHYVSICNIRAKETRGSGRESLATKTAIVILTPIHGEVKG